MKMKCFVKELSILLIMVLLVPSVEVLAANTGTQTMLKISGSVVPLNIGSRSGGIDWWSQFKHDPEHIGYSTSTGPNTNNVLWTYTAVGGNTMYASTAVVDGRVYAGSRRSAENQYGGVFYCLDAETGNKIWQFITRDGMYAEPAVVDGKVYVCTAADPSRLQGAVYCLDAVDGSVIWQHLDLECSYIPAAPVVTDGKLYFVGHKVTENGNELDEIYCLDASTGEFLWENNYNEYFSYGYTAVSNGKMFIGNLGDAKQPKLSCLDAENGKEIWTWNNNASERDQIYCAPTVVDGKIYVGTTGWIYGTDQGTVVVLGHVYCLNADDGSVLWVSKIGDSFSMEQSPTVAYGNVYIGGGGFITGGDAGGNFYCLNANDGSLIWQRSKLFYSTDIALGGCQSPTVADGKVYVSVEANDFYAKVYCFDAFDGHTIWGYQKNSYLQMFYTPALADEQLYVGSGTEFGKDGVICCFADIDPNAPDAPNITGPTTGKAGESIEYKLSANDPNGDDVYYYINWGDGSVGKWIGPYNSGETVIVSHAWFEKGNYEVRARAKDSNGLRSKIGMLKVTMPRDKTVNRPILQFLQQHQNMFPIIQKLLQRLGL